MSKVWPDIGLTHIHQLLQFLARVISRDLKVGCIYNFLKYLAFTYFIMLWSEMMRFHVTVIASRGALCKHGF